MKIDENLIGLFKKIEEKAKEMSYGSISGTVMIKGGTTIKNGSSFVYSKRIVYKTKYGVE